MKHHSILPLAAAVLGLLPLSSFAATQTVGGVEWEYKVESSSAIVTGVESGKQALTIPESLGEKSVDAVDAKAFAENSDIVSITIPQSVRRIGNRAFENCAALASVSIPGSVTNIGKRAFGGCGKLSSATIGEGVAAIGKEMFADCIRLGFIVLPASVKTIGDGAFLNCRALASLDLASVATVGDNAFLGCSGLKTVVFPDTLRHIGASAFANCYELLSVSIPETVESIDPGAFSGCYLLEYALLPTAFKDAYDTLGIPGRCVVRFWDAPDVPNTYIVKFNANGGTGKMAAQALEYGRDAKLRKSAFTRADYMFIGWALGKTGAVAIADAASVRNLASTGGTVTLYAQWAKKSCKVKFLANGGTGKMAKQTLPFSVATKLSANKFTRAGYVFAGWSKTPTGSIVYKDKKAVKNLDRDGRTVKLYAQWAKAKYKVIFRSNNGKAQKAKQTLTYGKSTPLRKNTFEFSGYCFRGWAKTPTGAVAYADGASVKNLRTDGKSLSLYAIWEDVATASSGEDAVDFSLLEWSYGGFRGGSAKLAARPRISSLSVASSGMSYAWVSGGCENLGASSAGDANCIAALFYLVDGQWRGGKFDWISTNRLTRDFKNIKDGYHGWPPDAISKGKSFAFVIVSQDGKKRTNVIRFDK